MRARRATAAGLTASALALSTLAVTTATSTGVPAPAQVEQFHRVATFPVFQNAPAGVDPTHPTVAEISAVSEDGRTLIHTDASGKRVGFIDITDPSTPVGAGSIDLASTGHADDQPTSVAVVGDLLLVVVDTSGGNFTEPSGRLDVFDLDDRSPIASLDLAGQPDSIAVSPDRSFAAVAIENQRDEEFSPPGADEGDLPQAPPGFVQVIALTGEPTSWSAEPVALTNPDGTALPSFVAAGLDTPQDPEPEYVDINDDNRLVVTLQENNGIVVIDLATRSIDHVFSAGNARVDGVDVAKDGRFDPTGTIDLPREPDAVQWVGDDLVATANEGDWRGGTRGWSVFDTSTGEVVWDAGNTFEQLAVRHGLHNDDRAGKKGSEPEGLAFDVVGGTPRAFVGSERSNFVAVYDMTDPADPRFEQVLPTTNGPEGLLPIPSRNLFVVSSEQDDAAANVRATVGLFELGPGRASFPSIVAADVHNQPIGWGALGALSADPADARRLYAASDAAYATGRVYSLDTSSSPATIDEVIEVTEPDGTTPSIDIEGLHARVDGGFWLAAEGATGADNKLFRTDADGVVRETVELPADVTANLGKQGLEGVTAHGSGKKEVVTVALQRPAAGEDFARIGRYSVATGAWEWFAYSLEDTDVDGDWIGLSEITALGPDLMAVVERDKLNGPHAAIKRLYTVDLSAAAPRTVGAVAPARPVRKTLAVDLLPHLESLRGWTQEKVEGIGITAHGDVYVVTDNDGLKDATGETQLLGLGRATSVFRKELRTTTTTEVTKKRVAKGQHVKVRVQVEGAGTVTGKVRILVNGKRVGTGRLDANGVAKVKVKLGKRGRARIRARYLGAPLAAPSSSKKVVVKVHPRKRNAR